MKVGAFSSSSRFVGKSMCTPRPCCATALSLLLFVAGCSSGTSESQFSDNETAALAEKTDGAYDPDSAGDASDDATAAAEADLTGESEVLAAGSIGSETSSCFGSSSYQNCTDATGNTYSTLRIGNSSFTDGYNSQTGSTWNQSTQRIGDTSFTTGTDSEGNVWNSTSQTIGDTTFQSGTDSEGNSFSRVCNEYGCN